MKPRDNVTNTGQQHTTTPWEPGSLAPSLAITADWWNQSMRLDPLAEELFQADGEDAGVTSALKMRTEQPAQLRCSACGSIVYSRRHPICGVCAHPLPPEVLFSESESSRIHLVVEMERRRYRQWLAKVG